MFLQVILNQVREYSQVALGLAVKSSMWKYFQVEGAFAGYLNYDKNRWHQFGQEHLGEFAEPSIELHFGINSVLDVILRSQRREVS